MTTAINLSPTDTELVRRAQAGDHAAFALLYDRWFDSVYDFLVRTLRSEPDAADATQDAFVKAMAAIGTLRNPSAFRGWLFSIARNTALMGVRSKQPADSLDAATDAAEEMPAWAALPDTDAAGDPAASYESAEAASIFWRVAASLDPRQYTVLDLSVRRELDAAEMAEVLGVSRNNAYVMVNRTRAAFAEAALDYLDYVSGRRDCPQLERELRLASVTAPQVAVTEGESWAAELSAEGFSKEIRRTIAKHVKRCDDCRERRKTGPAPLALFGALAAVPASAGLHAALRERLLHSPIAVPGEAALAVPASRQGVRRRWLAAAAVAVGILALLLLVAVRAVSGGDSAARVPDPNDVHSTSHTVGASSTVRVVQLEWTPRSSSRGYSVEWTHGAKDVPDATIDLGATASGTSSPTLDPGTWYFHLRTASPNGEWTSTVHLGPFVIAASTPTEPTDQTPNGTGTSTPAATGTNAPSATSSVSQPSPSPTPPASATAPATNTPAPSPTVGPATPEPTAAATPEPTGTPLPQPTPTAIPTPSPTATLAPSPTATPTRTPAPAPPTIVAFSCQPAKVTKGMVVHCSMDANGSATLITWVAPGGSPASAAGANDAALSFSTSYAQPGTYTITASICLGAACSSRSASVEVQ